VPTSSFKKSNKNIMKMDHNIDSKQANSLQFSHISMFLPGITHRYLLMKFVLLSFGVPREVVPLWLWVSNHKREIFDPLCLILYV
jgi:hypothetical protein